MSHGSPNGLALAPCPLGSVAGRSQDQNPHATLHDMLGID